MSISRRGPDFKKWRKHAPRELLNQPNLLLQAFAAERAERLRRSAQHSSSAKRRAAARRKVRQVKVAILNKSNRRGAIDRRKPISRAEVLLYQYPEDFVRDAIMPEFKSRWIAIRHRLRDRSVRQVTFKNFSFKRNPHGTISQLRELIEACATAPEIRLNFMDDHCDDVAPYIILAHLRKNLPPIITGGLIQREVHEVVDAVGLKKALKMGRVDEELPEKTSVSAFPMFNRVPPGAFGDEEHQLRPQYKEIIADHFVNTLNSWLEKHNIFLNARAEGKIVASFGEALDNAERHGGLSGDTEQGDWAVAAFSRLCKDANGKETLRCSVAMVSMGATISHSLQTAETTVLDRISSYTKRHAGIFSSNDDIDVLRTVMALQDGVTRVADATRGRRGGVGLMQLVNSFAELGENDEPDLQSVITILSGTACLRITSPYRQGAAPEGSKLRELWFNDANDANEPPDRDHVFSVGDVFPGTILSACFTIDPAYMLRNANQ